MALKCEFEIRLFQLKLAKKHSVLSFNNRGVSVKFHHFSVFTLFLWNRAILWELTENAVVWLLWDQTVPFKMARIKPAS